MRMLSQRHLLPLFRVTARTREAVLARHQDRPMHFAIADEVDGRISC